jgi:thioesterase domain-containing protein
MPARFSTLVPIRPRGSAPPLFLIHGVGGVVPDFGNLLDKLDPAHPVYGIQSQAFDPVNPALTTLEEIAAWDLQEIRRIFPHGPYCFIGFSFGGMVAYEMAQQLIAAGEKAPFVGMIDSCEMSYTTRMLKQDSPGRKASELSRRLKLRFAEAFQRPDTLRYVKEKIHSRTMRLLYSVFSGFGMKIPNSLQNSYHVNWFAAVNYSPKPFEGRITLFKANSNFWDRRLPPDLGWATLAMDGVEMVEIPGDHMSLFIEPHVTVLGDRLARCLEAISQTA